MLAKKQCSKCRKMKAVSEFYIRRSSGRRYKSCSACEKAKSVAYRADAAHRAHHRQYMRDYRKTHETKTHRYCRDYYAKNRVHIRQQQRESHQRCCIKQLCRKRGITVSQYNWLLRRSMGKCELCGSTAKLCLDHNHKTGRVRGFLCARCNGNLGYFESRNIPLRRIAAYLRRSRV